MATTAAAPPTAASAAPDKTTTKLAPAKDEVKPSSSSSKKADPEPSASHQTNGSTIQSSPLASKRSKTKKPKKESKDSTAKEPKSPKSSSAIIVPEEAPLRDKLRYRLATRRVSRRRGGGPGQSSLSIFAGKSQQQIFKHFAGVHQFLHQNRALIKLAQPVPRFVVVGPQNSGKSTVVQRFLGFPSNHIAPGHLATKRPLLILLQHDPTAPNPVCRVDGVVVDEAQVHLRLREKNSAGVSLEPVKLEVRSANVQNLVIVDTPGLGPGKDADAKLIKRIVKEEAGKPNSRLLVVLSAPAEAENEAVIDFLNEVDGEKHWSEDAVILVNKCDQPSSLASGAGFNRLLDRFTSQFRGASVFFTASEPQEEGDSYEQRKQQIRAGPQFEERVLQNWYEEIEERNRTNPRSGSVDQSKWDEVVGFARASERIYELLWDDLVDFLPEVSRQIFAQRDALERRLRELVALEHQLEEAQLKETLRSFVQALSRRMVDYLKGTMHISTDFPEALTTLREEVEQAASPDLNPFYHVQIPPYTVNERRWFDTLRSLSLAFDRPDSDAGSALRASAPLFGARQFPRALSLLFVAIGEGVRHVCTDPAALLNAIGYYSDGYVGPRWEGGCLGMLKLCASEVVHPAINCSVKHLAYDVHRFLGVAWEDVLRHSPDSRKYANLSDNFFGRMERAFVHFLERLTLETATKCHSALVPSFSVILSSLHSEIDHMVRNLNQPDVGGEKEKEKGKKDKDKHHAEEAEDASKGFNVPRLAAKFIPRSITDADVAEAFDSIMSHLGNIVEKQVLHVQREPGEFMPAQRTPMVTDEELKTIARTAVTYLHVILKQNFIQIELHFSTYFLQAFCANVESELRTVLEEPDFAPASAFHYSPARVIAERRKVQADATKLDALLQDLQKVTINGLGVEDDDQHQ